MLLNISEEIACNEMIYCSRILELRNIGKYFKIKCVKWGNRTKKVAYRVPEKEWTIVRLIRTYRLSAILYLVLIRRLKARDVYCKRRVVSSGSHW